MIFRSIYILHGTIFVAISSWNILWSFVHHLTLWVLGPLPHTTEAKKLMSSQQFIGALIKEYKWCKDHIEPTTQTFYMKSTSTKCSFANCMEDQVIPQAIPRKIPLLHVASETMSQMIVFTRARPNAANVAGSTMLWRIVWRENEW